DVVPRNIDASLRKKRAQALIDPRRRADAAALDDGKVAPFRFEVGVHYQEPVHALGLRADQFDAAKIGENGQRRMCRTADEVDSAVPQGGIGLVDRKDQFERDVETFGLEKSKLDRRLGGEI